VKSSGRGDGTVVPVGHDDTVIALALAVTGMKNFIYGKKEKPRVVRVNDAPVNAGFGF
jgi:hypothetical protein